MPVARQFFGLLNQQQRGALKLTINQFYRVNGDSTQNRGVVSDIELPSLTTHLDVGESDLDFALKFDQVPAVKHDKLKYVERPIVDQLRRASSSVPLMPERQR